MCGIAGIVRFDDHPIDRTRLQRMVDHVRHRGPDGRNITEYARCSFGHTRLSVIDLLSGNQPMHISRMDSHGPLHLVFNGEIYNHRDLRAKLEQRGHVFRSDHSDTEVLLFGYRQWGTMLPKHLHGMFAFAIWDEDKHELFLVRDRTGKKPLYFRRRTGEMAFASLIATLVQGMDTDESPQINRDSLLDYLRLGYTFQRSMIDGIEEIPAAHWMLVKADGTRQSERYWQPPPISKHSTSLGAVDAVGELLHEAVQKRLESDVPLGCFLSGGLDSSLVAALAQKRIREAGGDPLETFSVAMPDLRYDESAYALQTAEHIGSKHTVLDARPSDAIADMHQLMQFIGEPLADSSLLATYWLCQTTRQHVTVALSGDGGDELFGGYDRYRAIRLLGRHRWWLRCIPPTVLRGQDMTSRSVRLRRLVEAAHARSRGSEQYKSMVQLFSDAQIADLGFSDEIDQLNAVSPAGIPGTDWPQQRDQVHAAMRWDLVHYLPFDLLRKLDRASMAVALEVRCPFLDTQVCDLAGHLPGKVLMPGGEAKGLLKQYADRLLPRQIVHRKKRGFAVPMDTWFREQLRDSLADHLFHGELEDMGLNIKPIRKCFEQHIHHRADHTHRLFALLQLAIFARWLKSL